MARVLLIDDDEDVQSVLGRYLARDGHAVRPARTGQEALDAIAKGSDVVLLDLTLPDLDGLEVLRRIRAAGDDVAVLVFTARGEEADRLLGLGLGADDYVVKPVSPREICLRVAALVRRSALRPTDAPTAIVRVGALELHPDEHRVLADGREVALTPKEYDLLSLLARPAGRVHTRAVLLDALWPEGYVTEHVLDVHVAALRRKLGDSAHIVTVRGVGYRLAAPDRS